MHEKKIIPSYTWNRYNFEKYRDIYIFDHTTQNYSAGVKTWIKGNTPQTSQTHRM